MTTQPKLNLKLQIPQFSLMRITPPLKLDPLILTPLQFDYSNSQYQPLGQQILQKIGVKTNQENGFFSKFVSGIGCLSCTACKAMSRQTLMEIKDNDLQTIQKQPQKLQTNQTQKQYPQDLEKKERFQKIWKQQKKKHVRPSAVKFDAAFKKHHNLSDEEWMQKIKEYFN